MNAPQAFNVPTCHGNSRNASFNVLPRRVPIHAEPPPSPILAERHAFPLFAEKKSESSRNAQRSPPQRSNPRRTICRSPYSQNATLFLSSRRKARKQPERQLQRSPPPRSNPHRTSAVPHTRRTPRFSSLRGEKALKQPERSTFSPASFQSAQNHLPLPYTRRTLRFSSLRREKRESSRNAQRSPPQRSTPRRTICRSLRLYYLTSHKRQRRAKERQL